MAEFISIFLVCYFLHALGITIGYHRLLSHRSFCAPKPVEYFWVLMGYLAFEGSPIWWATIHRAHHRYTDTPLDPHSPRYGFYNAHIGWTTHKTYSDPVNPELQSKDLINDPIYKFLEQNGKWHNAHLLSFSLNWLVRIAILHMFGLTAALASILAAYAVMQVPLMLNLFCHIPMLGYKNYKSADDSVNVWWVGLLAMGEGWHNNHHAYPGSARTGMYWWELDVSWIIIKLMKKLNWAYRINEASMDTLTKHKTDPAQQISATSPQAAPKPTLSLAEHLTLSQSEIEQAQIALNILKQKTRKVTIPVNR